MGWAPMALAAASSLAWLRPVMATFAPAATSASAIPCPMPELPPVTRGHCSGEIHDFPNVAQDRLWWSSLGFYIDYGHDA